MGHKAAVMLVSISLVLPRNAHPAQYEVATVAALRDALLMAASNGEDDLVLLGAGTYAPGETLTYAPLEERSLTVRGAGIGLTVLDGGGLIPPLSIDTTALTADGAAAIEVEGISFLGGMATGGQAFAGLGVTVNSAPIALSNCEFTGHLPPPQPYARSAAAWLLSTAGSIRVSACLFADNTTSGLRVSSESGTITLSSSAFSRHKATAVQVWSRASSVGVEGCAFEGNEEPEYGGGLRYDADGGSLSIRDSVFRGNFAGVGGGVSVFTAGDALLEGNTFAENRHGYGYGGGADIIADGGVVVRGNVFTGNFGAYSGGMQVIGGVATVEGNEFRDNPGMAFAVLGGDVLCTRNLCSGNERGCGGVGTLGRTAVVSNNIVAGNASRGAGRGAGLTAWATGAGTVHVVNNTIWGNVSKRSWGGLSVALEGNRARAFIGNNVVWGNRGPRAGDILVLDDANRDGIGAAVRIAANDYASISVQDGDRVRRSGNLRVRPGFVDSEGGDLRLAAGSPCIDRGRNAASGIPGEDFLGAARIVDGNADGLATVDLGAFEFVP